MIRFRNPRLAGLGFCFAKGSFKNYKMIINSIASTVELIPFQKTRQRVWFA